MNLRRASTGDAEGIAAIWNHYIRETVVTFTTDEKSPAQVESLIASRDSEGHATFVAADRGQLLGFAGYGQFRNGPGYAQTLEHTVLLANGAKRRGIGRVLVGAILDHARARGGHSVFAGISSGNPEARAFHAAMGFREECILAEVGWKAGRWWDLHLMRVWL